VLVLRGAFILDSILQVNRRAQKYAVACVPGAGGKRRASGHNARKRFGPAPPSAARCFNLC